MMRMTGGVVAGIVLMTLAASAQQPAPGAAAPIKVVGSVKDIMVAMIMPSSDVVFNAGADEPKTAEDWDKLRLNAITLAESANLLMLGSRVRDRGDWMTMAQAQLDAAEAVVRLATEKKTDGLADASDKAYETCTTCHNKYWADRNNPR